MEKLPEFAQELKYAFDAIGVPGFALLQRAQKHFVHAQGIGTVTVRSISSGIDHVVLGFRHFFDLHTAYIFAVFQNKLGILKSSRQFLNFSVSSMSFSTIFTSTCNGEVLYCLVSPCETKVLVPRPISINQTIHEIASPLDHAPG